MERQYSSIPFLRNITPAQIRATPNAASHIVNIFIKRMFDEGIDVSRLAPGIEGRIMNELRAAITRGLVLSSVATEDAHNPRDRYLEMYSYVNMVAIDRTLNGTAKLKIACRLSAFAGVLSIRTVQRNFKIDMNRPAVPAREHQEEEDYPEDRDDYPDDRDY